MKLSANLGFLWADRSLPDAIRAAKVAGFDAVECHWPHGFEIKDISVALLETGLPMLGLNTSRGDTSKGENGLSALVEREADARVAIDEAMAYAIALNVPNIHVMAGFASGQAAHECFVENLIYACENAAQHGITILIEPLNKYDAPNYFLSTTEQAKAVIMDVGLPNLKLMFDCYHVQLMEGDIGHRLKALLPLIGHIQFASVPDRGTPDHGELNYAHVFQIIRELGYTAPLGAEYKPVGDTDASLGWMKSLLFEHKDAL
jgi:hydroxypyruvate isomerase